MARAVLGLTAYGAARHASHPCGLSEGRKRALVLAIQLSAAPRALLLAEPTRGLDYRAKTELVRIVDALAAQGRTVVISPHDAEFAARAADRIGSWSSTVLTTFRRARFQAPVRFAGPKLSDSRGR
ncbi:hypothetical protein BX281_0849 [Streptomyces sp. Ag82_O1-15]|nr:hypothetical protein BX281_0849 [Streptomyces sp. Ag82_O1-15]